jgi:UDPglucose 6-dehydrogenase
MDGKPPIDIGAAPSRITIVGCGHVGLVTAACFASLGHRVIGVDIDPARVAQLGDGRVPFMEPALAGLVGQGIAAGQLTFTTSYEEALAQAAFVFLCVDTPSTPTGAADLRTVRRAAASIGATLTATTARPVLVIKSTSPIGTGETIDAILRRTFPDSATRPAIVANPEFLREGSAVRDFLNPDRIVVGADDPTDGRRVAALYHGIEAPAILTDVRTAEMIKYVSNAFLATRVSFVNEVARLCEGLGVDLDALLHGVTSDPRIGAAFFQPGIGYGGSCLPKDVAALLHTGESVGVSLRVLAAVQEANLGQRKHAVNCIRRVLGPLEGLTIAAWGVTFKGGTEDLRASPALDVINLLRNEGAYVKAYDPALSAPAPEIADEICPDPLSAARDAQCVAVLADWPEFQRVAPAALRDVMAGRLVYDGRNILSRAALEAVGLLYHGVGKPPAWDTPAVERHTSLVGGA